MPFRIGQLEPASNLFLAPLAGYTNLPFRLIIREIGGAGLCTSDLVNARSLIEKNPKALKLIQSCPQDRPLAVQLFGAVMEEMRDAALFLESQGVNAVDVNMGCPVRKVCKVGGGSAMMTEHAKTARLAGTMVNALKIPVTCKMRLGWDDENITAPDLARALEDAGVAAITIHGRTRQQGFKGRVHLDGIRAVVQAVRCIPVIGNGDITTPQAAKIMLEQTGCAAVSIGRGAFYNPWIFRHTQHFLSTGELLPESSFEDRIAVMRRHLDLMVEVFGEATGCRMFRKAATWYSRRFGPAAEFNRRIVKLRVKSEFPEIIVAYREWRRPFLDENRRLGSRDEPPPLPSGFDGQEPAVACPDAIPVPAGPNELW
ncbi:MAG: tRNA dihydrouridine synthase DusB [Verrucomicrobia bacterium]|nr:tRNA dihydrouridine synthase DusB [Verrucomicrobiota bacterium]